MTSLGDQARRRQGGRCACGCGAATDVIARVFDAKQWPELYDEPDNVIAMRARCWECHLVVPCVPIRATRHAQRFATTPAMRSYLREHFVVP